jgi:type I restriction enzyme M protein
MDRHRDNPHWTLSPLGVALKARGEVTPLSQAARLLAGRDIPGARPCEGAVPEGSVPYVRIQDIRNGVVTPGAKCLPPGALKPGDERCLTAEDVLVSRSGTIGKTGRVGREVVGGLPSGGLHLIRADRERLDPDFLAAYLACADSQAWMASRAGGAVILVLRLDVLGGLPVPTPPLSIQRSALKRFRESGTDLLTLVAEELERA